MEEVLSDVLDRHLAVGANGGGTGDIFSAGGTKAQFGNFEVMRFVGLSIWREAQSKDNRGDAYENARDCQENEPM
jgi:hypothetical protein